MYTIFCCMYITISYYREPNLNNYSYLCWRKCCDYVVSYAIDRIYKSCLYYMIVADAILIKLCISIMLYFCFKSIL